MWNRIRMENADSDPWGKSRRKFAEQNADADPDPHYNVSEFTSNLQLDWNPSRNIRGGSCPQLRNSDNTAYLFKILSFEPLSGSSFAFSMAPRAVQNVDHKPMWLLFQNIYKIN